MRVENGKHNNKMKKIKCKICGKVIEGYTKKHIETLLAQHMIKHQNEQKENRKKI